MESDDSPRLQAGGFWIDAGVSSHTDRSFHAHERDKLKNNSCIAWHDWQDGIVFTRHPSWRNPYDIHLCTCKRTTDTFFLSGTKVEMEAATRRGFHPHGRGQGPFAANGKLFSYRSLRQIVAAWFSSFSRDQ